MCGQFCRIIFAGAAKPDAEARFCQWQDIGRHINRIYRYFQNERDAHNSRVYHTAKRLGQADVRRRGAFAGFHMSNPPSCRIKMHPVNNQTASCAIPTPRTISPCASPLFSIPRRMNACSHFITISIWWLLGGAPFLPGACIFPASPGAHFSPTILHSPDR